MKQNKLKIVITGGTGFIGQKLATLLRQQGHEIKILSRRSSFPLSNNLQMVRGDLTTDDSNLDALLDGCEVLFHCAGELYEKTKMRLLHVEGTKRLLQSVLKESARRKKQIHWVQLSSVGAYGPPQKSANEDRVITEETVLQPSGEYEITKAESDNIIIEASKRGLLTYSIVRPSNVFGAGMPNQSLRSLGKMIQKGFFFYIGSRGAIAPYIHVDDVVEVLKLCGTDPSAKGKIFNVSNDCLLEEMINGIAKTLGVKYPRLRLPEKFVRTLLHLTSKFISIPLTPERINALVSRTRYPSLRLKQELNFTPKFCVPKAIGEVIVKSND